jgi:hypothetical protein
MKYIAAAEVRRYGKKISNVSKRIFLLKRV